MEMVGGRRAALSVCLCVGGLPEDETARTLIHTLVGQRALLARALPASRGHPEDQNTDICTRTHTSVHMCTDIPPEHQRPLGHRHWLRSRSSACTFSGGDTQPVATQNHGKQPL